MRTPRAAAAPGPRCRRRHRAAGRGLRPAERRRRLLGGGAEIATATSAAEAGGMEALIAAAKKEGELNVIALPPDWANYGEIIKAFGAKYGIKVNSAQPDGSSQDEINAVNQLKGSGRAPDVIDLGMAVALANTSLFAPYKVSTWDDIPDGAEGVRPASGSSDYGGYMSIGYDSSKVPAITSRPGPAQAGVQEQGRAQRRPDAGQRGAQRRPDGLARQRRLARRHQQGRRLLPAAQGGRQLHPGPGHPGDGQERRRRRSSSTGTTCTPAHDADVADLEGRSSRRTPSSAATTRRRSTRTRRTRPPPGCGRSSSTPTRARTCGSRAAPGRSGWRP